MSNNANMLSPLALAFVGDAVFAIETRKRLVLDSNRPVNDLHKETVKFVNASSQANAIKKLLPVLNDEEQAVFKRGRNAHTSHTPKIRVRAITTTQRDLKHFSDTCILKAKMNVLRNYFI